MHRDAPSCTVMHRDGFINFWIAPNSTELLFIAFLSSYLHRDALRCTVMHRVAPWCTEMALLTSELHQIAPNCFLLHYILLFCTMMHRDAPRCTEMHRDAPSTTELAVCILNAPSCTKLYFLSLFAPWCTEMHQDAPRCTMMHRVLLSYYILYYLYLGKVTAIMRFCFSVHHGASWWITVHLRYSRINTTLREEYRGFTNHS